jgi:hypothetical protein
MRWRSGETVAEGAGVETFMILLLLMTEADCLDHQHRRDGRSASALGRAQVITARAV